MRAVVQRVSRAEVKVNGTSTGAISKGLMLLLGIEAGDTLADSKWLAEKIVRMRIFPDAEDKMNLDLLAVGGELLVVSQFTLHAATKKGNRPSFIRAARPEEAIPLYEAFLNETEQLLGKSAARGVFGAMMEVELVNDGPVTILIDSRSEL